MAAVKVRGARQDEFPHSDRSEDRFEPAVADLVGEFFGVVWTSPQSVKVRFYDLDGMVDPAMPQNADVTESRGRVLSGAAMSAGGAGVGYAVAWRATGGVGSSVNLRLRYVSERGFAGGEVAVTEAAPGVLRRRLVMKGYEVAGSNGAASHDGVNLVWVESDPSDVAAGRMSWDAFDSGYGRIMLQRYVVALDRSGYPAPEAEPMAVGVHGAIGGAETRAADLGAFGAEPIGRDPAMAVLAGGETVIAWIDRMDMLRARILPPPGSDMVAPADLTLEFGSAGPGRRVPQIAALDDGRFVLGWLDFASDDKERLAVVGRICCQGEDGAWRAGRTLTLQALAPAEDGFEGAWALRELVEEDGFSIVWRAGYGDVISQRFDRRGAARIEGRAVHRIIEDGAERGGRETATLVAPVGERVIALRRHDSDEDIHARVLRRRGDSENLPALRERRAQPVSAFLNDALFNSATGRTLRWLRRAAPKWGDDSTTRL